MNISSTKTLTSRQILDRMYAERIETAQDVHSEPTDSYSGGDSLLSQTKENESDKETRLFRDTKPGKFLKGSMWAALATVPGALLGAGATMSSFVNTNSSLLEGVGTGAVLNIFAAGLVAIVGNQPGQLHMSSSNHFETRGPFTRL